MFAGQVSEDALDKRANAKICLNIIRQSCCEKSVLVLANVTTQEPRLILQQHVQGAGRQYFVFVECMRPSAIKVVHLRMSPAGSPREFQ